MLVCRKNGYSCLDMLGEETRNIQLRVEKMRVEGNKEEGDLKNWKNVFIPCWCWGRKVPHLALSRLLRQAVAEFLGSLPVFFYVKIKQNLFELNCIGTYSK